MTTQLLILLSTILTVVIARSAAGIETRWHHFSQSKWKGHKNEDWYNPLVSWTKEPSDGKTWVGKLIDKTIESMFSDAYHTDKSIILLSSFAYAATIVWLSHRIAWWTILIVIACYVVGWFVWRLYYKRWFLKKQFRQPLIKM